MIKYRLGDKAEPARKRGKMSEGKIGKIQKSSKIAFAIARVLKIIFIVTSVIAILAGIFLIGFKGLINSEIDRAVARGEFTIEEIMPVVDEEAGFEMFIADQIMKNGYFSETMGAYLITIGVRLICLAVVVHFIGKVFREIEESYSPFKPQIVKSIKVAFILITLLSLENSLLIGIMVGFSLWSVVNIFKYGCELQKMSDETL